MNAGCAGKTVDILENAAVPERLIGVFTMRHYTNSWLSFFYLDDDDDVMTMMKKMTMTVMI